MVVRDYYHTKTILVFLLFVFVSCSFTIVSFSPLPLDEKCAIRNAAHDCAHLPHLFLLTGSGQFSTRFDRRAALSTKACAAHCASFRESVATAGSRSLFAEVRFSVVSCGILLRCSACAQSLFPRSDVNAPATALAPPTGAPVSRVARVPSGKSAADVRGAGKRRTNLVNGTAARSGSGKQSCCDWEGRRNC